MIKNLFNKCLTGLLVGLSFFVITLLAYVLKVITVTVDFYRDITEIK